MTKNSLKSIGISITIILISVSVLCLYTGCSASKENRFQKRIMKMSDEELVGYYHGINDRLKDLDNNIKYPQPSVKDSQDQFNHRVYEDGIPAYDLMQKKKKILAELKKRNIRP